MGRRLTLDEAASELGVPAGSLRTAAQEHGFLVKMSRGLRIDPDDLQELVRQCRTTPKDRGSIADATAGPTLSATATDSTQRALETAATLKRLSRGTSQRRTDRLGPLLRIK